MSVGLAAPGAFLFCSWLVWPSVFFLAHALGEDADSEVAGWACADFGDQGTQVVPEGDEVWLRF